ncbi:hypothetical protein LWI29_033737 [Acer saccharum]|uniref:DNA topoisomerase n=1 Tax=Acer saccharum TaxID=4024 RepID=A0AA39W3G0_ACESA|nr:hypothetical protein LWI29_033737 [Acer saccharum]
MTLSIPGFELFKELLETDPFFTKIMAGLGSQNFSEFFLVDGFLFHGNQLCIPECSLRLQIIKELHGEGHVGRDRTLQLVWDNYFWPTIRREVERYVERCHVCQDDDEADTVGCCTLKVSNVECIPPNKLKFDFLGKDSIQYVNTVEVELPVYKAIGQFQGGKKQNDDLFDKLDTAKLNAHLKELMPGLTAKVLRTFNASITLDEMLSKGTKQGEVAEKISVYQNANKEVAIICNHQRTVSKSHGAQISKLTDKIEELKDVIKDLKIDLDRAKKGSPH